MIALHENEGELDQWPLELKPKAPLSRNRGPASGAAKPSEARPAASQSIRAHQYLQGIPQETQERPRSLDRCLIISQ
jgi:hypothetical protein